MSKRQDRIIAGFTTGERDYIRRELDIFFSTLPSVAEGLSPQDLARWSRCRQAQAAADGEGVDCAWPHAA
jgi:hypothetical protein